MSKELCPKCDGNYLEILKIDKEKEEEINLCDAFLSGRIKSTTLKHYIVYRCKDCEYIFRKEIDTYD